MRLTQEICDYIEACYVGPVPGKHPPTRLFKWGRGHEGESQDFMFHLVDKFGKAPALSSVHACLRKRGHQLFEAPHPTSPSRPVRGRVRAKAPEPSPRGSAEAQTSAEGVRRLVAAFRSIADGLLAAAAAAEQFAAALQVLESDPES